MGTKTPAAGGESKNKPESTTPATNHHGRRGNNSSHQRADYSKMEKFLGADPNLQGSIFEARRSRADQVANFEKVDNLIKTQIGMECHLSVLESLEQGKKILPKEPTPVLDTAGNMNSV